VPGGRAVRSAPRTHTLRKKKRSYAGPPDIPATDSAPHDENICRRGLHDQGGNLLLDNGRPSPQGGQTVSRRSIPMVMRYVRLRFKQVAYSTLEVLVSRDALSLRITSRPAILLTSVSAKDCFFCGSNTPVICPLHVLPQIPGAFSLILSASSKAVRGSPTSGLAHATNPCPYPNATYGFIGGGTRPWCPLLGERPGTANTNSYTVGTAIPRLRRRRLRLRRLGNTSSD